MLSKAAIEQLYIIIVNLIENVGKLTSVTSEFSVLLIIFCAQLFLSKCYVSNVMFYTLVAFANSPKIEL